MSDAPQAARLGDGHLCPQHIGNAIVTNAAPTILIEGRPAARINSQLVCMGGPLDTVGIGEPTVLLCGLDAARKLDGTQHGGLISEGAPTVLIGSMSAMEKRLRLLARLALIDASRKKAADMPDGPEKQALEDAANRLAENNRVVEDARLAVKNDQIPDVYDDSGAPEGWTRLSTEDLPPELQNAVFHDDESGFYADIFRSDIDGSYRLVFRGSEQEINDWKNNFEQGLGYDSKQYDEAVKLAQQVAEAYGSDNISFTGHSLGGGLASAASLATGIPATTFNPAGLSQETIEKYGLDASRANELIDVYQTDGEMLTWAQEQLAPWVKEHVPWTDLEPPVAPGTKHPLPAYDYDEVTKTFTPRPDPTPPEDRPPGPWWSLRNPAVDWAIDTVENGKYLKELMDEAVYRHTNAVIGGIEKQKADDIATMMTALGMMG